MKNLITYLKALWRRGLDSQSTDVSLDCRRSDLRRSPSGLDAKWKQNPFMRFAVVFALVFVIGVGNVWGAENDTHDFAQTLSQLLNNNASIADVTVAEQSYTVKSVIVTVVYNKTAGGATVSVKVGGTTFGSAQTINSSTTTTFTYNGASAVKGQVVVSSKNNCGSGTGKGTFKITNVRLVEGPAAGPSITTSVSSLSDVGYSTEDFSQQVKSFTVSGSSLTANVTVTAPTNYEVCKTSGGTYTSSVTFDKGSGTLATSTVYVRLQSGKTAGNYSGNVTCSSTGATTKNVAVSGSVPFTVTWKANGTTHATTYVAYATSPGTALGSLPDDPDPSDYTCSPKAFYGWYDGVSYSNASVAPSVINTSTKITTDKTYNAVFATSSGGGGSTTLLSEDFSSITTGNSTATSGSSTEWSVNSNFNSKSYAYQAGGAVKLGSGSNAGYLVTKQLTAAIGDKITIAFKVKGWSSVEGNIQVSGNASEFTSPSAITYTATMSGSFESKSVTVTLTKANPYIKIATTAKRAFIDDIVITKGASITYSNYATSCCTPLGSINGSINMSSSTDGTVTVKDWNEVSYASSYTVKLYQKDGESWDLVAGDAGTKTGITNRSTGATFSGLTYGATYKFTVTAIGTGSYCNGPETAVTSINGNSLTNNEFLNKYSIYIDDGTNSDSGWGHHYIESLSSHTGNVTLNSLTADATYKFKLTLGRVIWYSANATMTSSNCTNWTFYSNVSENCGMTTGLGGNYIFAINAETPTVSVTYPSASQAADKIIYWDASIHGDAWSKLCFRVGTSSNSNARETTKESSNLVPGTDQFYKMLTCDFGSMEAWTIANNTGWTGTNSVYRTDDEGDYTVTKSIAYQDYAVVDPITIIPTTSGSAGGSSENDGCTFYTLTKYDGMLTHNISVGSADHGTVVATYTNTSGTTGQTVAEGANSDLAHRCIVTITATPDAGYTCSSLTVNGAAFTSGSTHILAADATVAATFTAKTYNITLDREGADNGSTSVTMTYNSATHTAITAPTKSGYDFGGWYSGDNGTGTMVMNASGVLQATVSDYTGAGGIWTRTTTPTTLYAKWTPINYTITYHLNDGTNPGGVPTGFTIESALITLPTPTREGYNFMGWYANEDLSTGGVQTTIAAGSTVNKEYWAKWEIKKYTVTWHVGDATGTTSNVEHGTTFSSIKSDAGQPAHGDAALSACGSTKFIGWVKAGGVWDDEGKTSAWYDTYKAADADEITSDTHYYAMYAEGASTSKTFEFEITSSDFNSTSYAANNNEKTTTATATDASGATMDVKWTSYQIMLQSSAMQWQKKAGYIYNSTDLGTVNSVTITSSAGVYSTVYGTSEQPSSGSAGTGNGYFKTTIDNTATGSMTSYVVNFTKSTTTYSNYRTGCTVTCSRPTPALPTSIGKTGATISWTDPATSGTLDHYEYKVWEDGDDEPVSGTTNGKNLSKALTGLYSGVTYHWKVRRVCDGEDASIWAAGSDFTTTDATLTFSVPTDATAVDPSTTATNLPEADAPTDCGDCWVFVGWTTAAYAESSSAPATLFPAGIKARVSGDATLYAVYGKDEGKYRIIDDISSITSGENYVLTKGYIPTTDAVGNANSGSYYRQIPPVAITVKTDIIGEYIDNPATTVIWKLIGDASKGRLFNETASLYIDLHASTGSIDYLVSSTSDYINITLYDAETKTFNIGSNTTSTNYLFYWTDEEDDNVHWWGVDDEHDGFSSCCIFKHVYASYATSPSCPKYTVTWDVNNGASTSTTEVTKCQGYLASLPSIPSNTTLSSCQTNGKFMGWSPNKVMPAQDAVPTGMFNDVEDAPEITEDVTFYAVFAEEHSGATGTTNRTYTFTSNAWADDESAWTGSQNGNSKTNQGVQVCTGQSGVTVTSKSSYDDVTKVTVTYSTNAKAGAGSISVTVNGTTYTASASVTSTGGTSDRTIDFTPPSSALDGEVEMTVTCSTNSIYIKSIQIFYTGSTTTYDGYRTACCNDPGLAFVDENSDPVTEYVIVREDLASASSVVEIDCDISSLNTTEDITWKQTKRIKTDYHTANTWNASQTDRCQIDITNHKISAYETGSWQITIEQLMGSTNYCDGTATVNILVKTIDKFIDAVNGNFSGEAQSLEDVGNGIILPTEATFSTNNGCADGTTRRLIGWIKASDLATYASSRRVDMIDDLKTSDPATNTVIAPGTKVQATGVTWYAVWGVEK